MSQLRSRDRGVGGRAVLLPVSLAAALVLGGCADDREAPAPQGGVDGGTAGGAAAGKKLERVATDDLTVGADGAVVTDCWNGICTWDEDGALTLLPDRGSVAVSPDGRTIATVDTHDTRATVVLSDLASGDVVAELGGLGGADVADGSPVTAVSFSGDGSRIAAVGLGPEVRVWSVDDGGDVATFPVDLPAWDAALSPDGRTLALAGDGAVEVHDVKTGEPLGSPEGAGEGGPVAWSPDGRWLLGPDEDGTPVVWDASSLAVAARLPDLEVREAAFSPDSSRVVLTAHDETDVLLWTPGEPAAAASRRRLRGHADHPGAVAWAPAGDVVYSVSADEGVLAWDLDRPGRPTRFELPPDRD